MIQLDITRLERDFGIGCNTDKVIAAIHQDEEPEITLNQNTGETIVMSEPTILKLLYQHGKEIEPAIMDELRSEE